MYGQINTGGGTVGLPVTYILDANATVRLASQGAVDQDFLIDKINEVFATPYGPQ